MTSEFHAVAWDFCLVAVSRRDVGYLSNERAVTTFHIGVTVVNAPRCLLMWHNSDSRAQVQFSLGTTTDTCSNLPFSIWAPKVVDHQLHLLGEIASGSKGDLEELYFKIKGDCYRCLVQFATGAANSEAAEDGRAAHADATKIWS